MKFTIIAKSQNIYVLMNGESNIKIIKLKKKRKINGKRSGALRSTCADTWREDRGQFGV